MTDAAEAAARPGDKPLPRLALLREMTDRTVLEQVFDQGRVTRAALAETTGISKPTISESVRRLESSGVLRASGSNETGRRGRVATYYTLAPDAGHVLAVEVNQHGVRTLSADLAGNPHGTARLTTPTAEGTEALADALRTAVAQALRDRADDGALRALAVSVANPVAPQTRTVIALPDSPFPENTLDPRTVLAELAPAPCLVDNDVNFAALAERRAGAAADTHSFLYAYIGAGLGLSLYVGDQLIRGAHGLAGEIGYLNTAGTNPPLSLSNALARQGFGRPGSPALDVGVVTEHLARAASGDTAARAAVDSLSNALGQALAAACTVVDPELVLLGGPLGGLPELLEPIRATVAGAAFVPVRIELGTVTDSPGLRGALLAAVEAGRAGVLASQPSR
ncbi:ROK family transcriptional regulator [Streptomyces sp. NPDC041068]|uniref:ROK family transcriptional regulator n=1 Tax=Streptomyces sp. NPDC041068 TaxID=3155130 RepID=UPI0033EDF358